MEGSSLSPAVARMVAVAASATSFQESSLLLKELAAVEVNAKQVERCAESIGEEMNTYEQQTMQPDSDTPVSPTLYLGMDGTGLPMRALELEGASRQTARRLGSDPRGQIVHCLECRKPGPARVPPARS